MFNFRFRMERPHQFGFGTWNDAMKVARELENMYGLDVFIDLVDRATFPDAYFADLRNIF